MFAQIFSSNCTQSPTCINFSDSTEPISKKISDLQITPSSVCRAISNLDSSIASGPDSIPAIIFKKCGPELSPILSKLFNKCLSESSFPECWKCANIVPAFKNCGDRSDPSKYRPISLLPIVSKIFETLINKKLTDHLESLGLLTDKQYGFRKNRSTADLLTVITERIYRALDRCGEAKSIALDISKAFDRVWHAGLLSKIRSFGISGKIYAIVKSFLSERQINVVLEGQHSKTYSITSGVPQGSILGPTMFLMFINDLPDNLVCNLVMYADDSTLYSCLDEKSDNQNRLDLVNSLELDLDHITTWADNWHISINSEKTKVLSINRYKNLDKLSISMSGKSLQESTSFRLVGLTISNELTWNEYINSIAKKASMKVGTLYRARSYLSPECILHLYKSLIRPCMEYCCHIWAGAPATVLSLLDRIQRRVSNIIGPKFAANLQSLHHRRNVASLCLFYRYYNGMCSSELFDLVPPNKVFNRCTRLATNSHPFTVEVPSCQKKFYAASFFPRTSVMWNSLPLSCFPDSYNLNRFKSRVNRYLLTLK